MQKGRHVRAVWVALEFLPSSGSSELFCFCYLSASGQEKGLKQETPNLFMNNSQNRQPFYHIIYIRLAKTDLNDHTQKDKEKKKKRQHLAGWSHAYPNSVTKKEENGYWQVISSLTSLGYFYFLICFHYSLKINLGL